MLVLLSLSLSLSLSLQMMQQMGGAGMGGMGMGGKPNLDVSTSILHQPKHIKGQSSVSSSDIGLQLRVSHLKFASLCLKSIMQLCNSMP